MKKTALLSLAIVLGFSFSACDSEKEANVKERAGASSEQSDAKTDNEEEEPEMEEVAEDAPRIGDTVEVGAWDVKVLKVEADQYATLKQANQFNDPAKGQYVLVTYEATYTGEERIGDTMMDLSWSFTSVDNKVSDPAMAVTPADNEMWPTEARKGGTVKGQAVFDVTKGPIKNSILTVETYDENFDVVYADFTL